MAENRTERFIYISAIWRAIELKLEYELITLKHITGTYFGAMMAILDFVL